MLKRLLSSGMVFFFFVTSIIGPNAARAQALILPAPGTMVMTTPDFMPVMIKGVQVHPENPLLFDFILDTGKSGLKTDGHEFKSESQKLIKYFLASLTIKEDDLWVNLSPYEKDRMIPEELGKTELGRDMLAQDYILKQLTASLIYPERDLGKAFWQRVYTKAQEQFGTTDIPVDTFNKVWIVADKAKVLERNNTAYVIGSHLKVMLETDYTATTNTQMPTRGHSAPPADSNERGTVSPSQLPNELGLNAEATQVADLTPAQQLARDIIREVILPEIEKEVNQGQNFAPLRQMYYAMILASWYKLALKDALLNQVYSNKAKTSGVLSDDPAIKEKIYVQYLESFRKGVFNYIKEDIDPTSNTSMPTRGHVAPDADSQAKGNVSPGTLSASQPLNAKATQVSDLTTFKQSIPCKYFSGGEVLNVTKILDRAQTATPQELAEMKAGDLAMASVQVAGKSDAATENALLKERQLAALARQLFDAAMVSLGEGDKQKIIQLVNEFEGLFWKVSVSDQPELNVAGMPADVMRGVYANMQALRDQVENLWFFRQGHGGEVGH